MTDWFSSGERPRRLAAVCGIGLFLVTVGPLPMAGAADVGVAAAVNTDAFGTRPGGARSAVVLGQNVVFNERIETDGSGLVQVLLVDGSTFTVGANSDLVIDEFVYDPESGSGKLVASFGKGIARFVGGKLSKSRGGVTVKTPVGTIGIRGGIANLNLNGDAPVFSLLFGDGLTFIGPDGQTSRVYKPGYSMVIGGGQQPTVRRTTQGDLGNIQIGLIGSGQNGGSPNPPTGGQLNRPGIPSAFFRPGQGAGFGAFGPNGSPRNPLQDIGRRLQQQHNAQQRRLRNMLHQSMESNDPTYYPE